MKLFEQPELSYPYNALEPYIDARTVEIHYTRHHATYLKNFNTALEKHPKFFDWKLEEILKNLNSLPEDIRATVCGNGGGYYNHNLYWENMHSPNGSQPGEALMKVILASFGSLAEFKTQFEKAGLTRLGSGYAWLSQAIDGRLVVHSTANQDTPLEIGLKPLLVCDVWEHAYYLFYQNRRADYLSSWWNLVNWQVVGERYNTL